MYFVLKLSYLMKLLHKMNFIVFILYLYYIIFIFVNQYMYWEFIHPESNSEGKGMLYAAFLGLHVLIP